eukprot:COSAG03_NODE_1067_length_4919_cov_1.767842_4_plen_69_part_00
MTHGIRGWRDIGHRAPYALYHLVDGGAQVRGTPRRATLVTAVGVAAVAGGAGGRRSHLRVMRARIAPG